MASDNLTPGDSSSLEEAQEDEPLRRSARSWNAPELYEDWANVAEGEP